MRRSREAGFTLIEVMVASVAATAVALGVYVLSSTGNRLVAQNFASNHGHDDARNSFERVWSDVSDESSPFRLVDVTGVASFVDLDPPAKTADTDPLTGYALSERAGGFRFWRKVGGPFRIDKNVAFTDTDVSFNFGTFKPQVGDKVIIPLFKTEYFVSAVLANNVVRLQPSDKTQKTMSFTLPDATHYIATGVFFRWSAYTVYKNQLRYHDNFSGASRATFTVVRNNVTSPKPFFLAFPPANNGQVDRLNLHIALETSDQDYSARKFAASTTILQGILTPRTFPTLVSIKDITDP